MRLFAFQKQGIRGRGSGLGCFPTHLSAVSAVLVQVAQDQGQTMWACQGMRLAKRRRGRWFGEKVAEERKISVDIGCPGERQGKEAGREGTGSSEGEQGGPPKHVSRYACTLQWWGCRPGAGAGNEPEESNSLGAPPAAGLNAEHDEAAAAGVAEFWISAFLRAASVAQGSPGSTPALTPRLAGCSQGRHKGGVDCDLDPSPERQTVCYDLDAAVILPAGCDIEVIPELVLATSAAAESGSERQREPEAPQQQDSEVRWCK
ncbi:hypothetical protein AK812_SmicGene44056 [Symbiodinium microadriaticum]|uniref:Uncharacterized protein n=1 Tax=Symbiodinium microadriaticum TaxID=2951 RepID=A0A1Q9BZH1_SYMMI|nr:hypothetical protein AK812_SmicGene44056 [Symbiodinium microadriaticum]